MTGARLTLVYDRLIVFALCGLIYFLPISIALLEIFSSLAISIYFVKRFHLWCISRSEEPDTRIAFWFQLKRFLLAFRPVATPVNVALGIFLLVNFLSVIFSQNILLSIKGFLFKLLESVLLFVVFVEGMRTRQRVVALVSVFFVSAGLLGIDGLFQYVSGRDFIFRYPMGDAGRAQASFKHANDFGTYLVFIFPLIFGILFCRDWVLGLLGRARGGPGSGPRWYRRIYRAGLFLIFMSVFLCLGLTYSRGAWLGFLAGLALWMFVDRKNFYIPVIFGVFFITLFYSQIFVTRPIVQFSQTTNESVGWGTMILHFLGNSMGRTGFWQEAINIIKDYPVLGIGLNTYSEIAPQYKINWGGYPHNCYLQLTAETGVTGLLAFLWLVISFYRHSLRALKRVGDPLSFYIILGLLCGILAVLVHGIFDTNFYSVKLANLPWIGMGLVFAILSFAQTPALKGKTSLER